MFEAARSRKREEFGKPINADSCDYQSYAREQLVCEFCEWFVLLKKSKNGKKFFAHFPNQPEKLKRECKYRKSVYSNTKNTNSGEDRGQRLEIVQAEFLKMVISALNNDDILVTGYQKYIDDIKSEIRKSSRHDEFIKVTGMVSNSFFNGRKQDRNSLKSICETNNIKPSGRNLSNINGILGCFRANTNALLSDFIQYGIYKLEFDDLYAERHQGDYNMDYHSLWRVPLYPHKTVAILYDYLIYLIASVEWSQILD